MPLLESDHDLDQLLRGVRSVAVVGASPRADRPSHSVAAYLIANTDWTIHLVNPRCDSILGRTTVASLADLPSPPDLVDVFRRRDLLPEVARQAIAVGAGALWFQLDLIDGDAAAAASTAGLDVVQNRCLRVEHERMLRGG